LKWGETEYKGRLVSVDLYMNIQLSNTEEFVLWIGKAEEVEPKAAKDTDMSG
jgi:small nuclear ribonucleoprotein F